MTATEELRGLLDERGVEWKAPRSIQSDDVTQFTVNGDFTDTWWEAFELNDGMFQLTSDACELTPLHVIEATLGRERTCHWDYPQGINGWVGEFACSNCGHQFNGNGDGVWEYCPNCGAKVVER